MNHLEIFDNAIEAAQEDQRAIYRHRSDPEQSESPGRGLTMAIENLQKLIEPQESKADGCRAIID